MSSSNTNTAEAQKTSPQDIGWMFAQEYYKFLTGEPSKLYCFYGKKSTCLHGTEGDVVSQINGEQEIHASIDVEKFMGTKINVSNVDTLPSINGGILVQVIGKMFKEGESCRRFVQTFFLAEQEGGYYVQNDILRYLKDDASVEEEKKEEEELATVPTAVPPAADTSATAVVADEATPAKAPAKPQPQQPPSAAKKEDKINEAVAPKKTEPAPEAAKSTTNHKAPVASASAPAPAKEAKPEAVKEKPVAPSSAAPAPTKPSSWALLAADGSNKWGSNNVTARVGGTVSAAPPASPTTSAGPNKLNSDTPPRVGTPSGSSRRIKNEALSVFLKNIPPNCQINAIKYTLKQFGHVVFVEYSGMKTGIVEFGSDAAKQAALAAGTVSISGNIVNIEERRPPRQGSGRRGDGSGGTRGGHSGGGGGAARSGNQRPGQTAGASSGAGRRGGNDKQ